MLDLETADWHRWKILQEISGKFQKDWNKFLKISGNFPPEISELTTLVASDVASNMVMKWSSIFPGPPGWASARRELLDFMVEGKINRGRHTDHPAGRHSIWTNECPPPPSPYLSTSTEKIKSKPGETT